MSVILYVHNNEMYTDEEMESEFREALKSIGLTDEHIENLECEDDVWLSILMEWKHANDWQGPF